MGTLTSIFRCMMAWSLKFRRSSTPDTACSNIEQRYFLIGSIDPRLPASILAVFQIIFSVSCLIAASVYIEERVRGGADMETSIVLGVAVTVFSIQIILSAASLYAVHANNATILLCQIIWQLVSPVVFGVLCAIIVNKAVESTLLIGYILMVVSFVSTPICAVDALMVFIYIKTYQMISYRRHIRTSTSSGGDSCADVEARSTSTTPTTLTLSSVNPSTTHDHSSTDYYEETMDCMQNAKKRAILPPTPVAIPCTEPPRRCPPARNLPVYSVSGRRTTAYQSVATGSYSSMRWTQGEHFAELIHRTPTGQFVLNLREEFEGRHTEA